MELSRSTSSKSLKEINTFVKIISDEGFGCYLKYINDFLTTWTILDRDRLLMDKMDDSEKDKTKATINELNNEQLDLGMFRNLLNKRADYSNNQIIAQEKDSEDEFLFKRNNFKFPESRFWDQDNLEKPISVNKYTDKKGNQLEIKHHHKIDFPLEFYVFLNDEDFKNQFELNSSLYVDGSFKIKKRPQGLDLGLMMDLGLISQTQIKNEQVLTTSSFHADDSLFCVNKGNFFSWIKMYY